MNGIIFGKFLILLICSIVVGTASPLLIPAPYYFIVSGLSGLAIGIFLARL